MAVHAATWAMLSACAVDTLQESGADNFETAAERRPAARQTVFVATDGIDPPDCGGGTRETPWRSLHAAQARRCIGPGTRVLFLPGAYRADSDVFHGRINVSGDAESPIVVMADPRASDEWPVRFEGAFVISHAEHLIVDGIDFVRAKRGQDVLAIGANHVTIRNSRIRGLPGDYNPRRVGPGDCVKIAGGAKDVHHVALINNRIHDCPQDAIDITGRRDLTIRGNDISNAWFFQIKGGAERVVVDGNRLRNMRYGITGNGMDCTKAGIYCGSPRLPHLPVEARFQAAHVQVTNNQIRDIDRGRAIDFTGWVEATIRGNVIERGNVEGGAVFGARRRVNSVFTDDEARRYCASGSPRCTPCRMRGGGECWRIRLPARNIDIRDNVVRQGSAIMLDLEDGAVDDVAGICVRGNRFAARTGRPVIRVGKRATPAVEEIGRCTDDRPRTP